MSWIFSYFTRQFISFRLRIALSSLQVQLIVSHTMHCHNELHADNTLPKIQSLPKVKNLAVCWNTARLDRFKNHTQSTLHVHVSPSWVERIPCHKRISTLTWQLLMPDSVRHTSLSPLCLPLVSKMLHLYALNTKSARNSKLRHSSKHAEHRCMHHRPAVY